MFFSIFTWLIPSCAEPGDYIFYCEYLGSCNSAKPYFLPQIYILADGEGKKILF